MSVNAVKIDGALARLTFDRYDLGAYESFLKVKALPEHQLSYDWESDSYEVTTPARFAARLTSAHVLPVGADWDLAPHLFDYQAFVLRMALDARRFACWLDTGLGKTSVFLEWSRQVRNSTGGRVLILSPLAIIPQTMREAERFYGDGLGIEWISTREALIEWCKRPGQGIGICNWEKLIPGIIPEFRFLAGVVAEESGILKSGGGVIKWNAIKSCRGIEYKLSCTATPAPNDTMEYASQASFLEKLRTEGEILWTYFIRNKQGDWIVKPHARAAFYQFMASWSIYLQNPAHFGFADILATLPPPEIHEYTLPLSGQQRLMLYRLTAVKGGLFSDDRMGIKERSQLAQVARGFLYEPGSNSKRSQSVESSKPQFVADLVQQERAAGRQCIVWTVFDEESRILQDLIGHDTVALDGSMSLEARADALQAFGAGSAGVLLTKPQLAGYGLNMQFCRSMVFSGIDDSFERAYQAVRRCYRFGQTETVHVHYPYIPELEGLVWSNVKRKEQRFMADVAECEAAYKTAIHEMYGVAS